MEKKSDAPITTPATNAPKALSQNPWDLIEPNATVLYREKQGEGWFECIVISTSKDRKTLTIKWRDYPSYKPFDVKRIAVGLLCKVS
jgi:hypothetical protein